MFQKSIYFSKNLTQEVILGTSFFIQIYPFNVTQIGITTKVVGTKLIFTFLTSIKTKKNLELQQNTIKKTINTPAVINHKQQHIQQ